MSSRLGAYEILAPIGAGGMGEVYRARDSKLGRDVAIKVLPEAFARDAARMARFGREAKLLAALNHTSIASIYGLEDSNNIRALVMELAEGPTLAERIAQGPIPVADAVSIAKQIADALEYAHEKGIIHRDLKPANVKVSADDTVKILDFGLAKALESEASAAEMANSPTISRMATQAGVLLGTAAYMSPEQAKAKPVDRRADIWAFGCVLYEMLTAKMAFRGDTVTETLAAIITKDPDWSQLPAATPMRVRVLLQRCLQKDPKQRLRDIGDARISLDEVLSGAPEAGGSAGVSPAIATPTRRRATPWTLFGLTAVALAALAFFHFREQPAAPGQLLRYELSPPEKTSFVLGSGDPTFALSPDGRKLAFMAKAKDGPAQLWVRDLDSLVSRPVPETEAAVAPFWSPDSRTLGFRAGTKLEKVDISGGTPQVICDAVSLGASWSPDGVIVFGNWGGLMSVPAAGGTPAMLIKSEPSRGEIARLNPIFLPDGRRFLYYVAGGPSAGTYLGSLDTGPEPPASKPLVTGPALYAPASVPGHGRIVFGRSGGALMAQAFDASRGEMEGEPAAIAEGVTGFTVSANGVLAYTGANSGAAQLTWFDRQGKVLGALGELGMFQPTPRISPDDSTVVIARIDSAVGGSDLWLYNVARGTPSRLTFDGKTNNAPVWSPDGSHVAFLSVRDGGINIYQKAVNGMGQEEAFEQALTGGPSDWSRDGRYLIEQRLLGNRLGIWVLPLTAEKPGGERKSAPYQSEGFNESFARVSPNGQWIAYNSDETGPVEVFVGTFPKPGGKWPVSVNGGSHPVWSRDGKELYFIGLDGKLLAVDVKSGPGGSFQAGAPKALFDSHIQGPDAAFDVTKDGRFLVPTVVGQSGGSIKVVVNWQAALKK